MTTKLEYVAAIVGSATTVHLATRGATAEGVVYVDTLCGSGRGRTTRVVEGLTTVTCTKCNEYRTTL